MPITHQEIAERLGVSRTLVTGALHGTRRSGISAGTQELIQRTAREMGYQPRNRTTHTIGYVLPVEKLALEAEVAFLMNLQRELGARGYRLTLADLDIERPRALQEIFNPKTVDGVIFSRWYDGAVQKALAPQMPWLLTSDEDGIGDDVELMAVDVESTLRRVMEYLLGFGHERFCLIVGGSESKYHRLIKHSARWALADSGLRNVHLTPVEVMTNREIAAPLLDALCASQPVTAVIAVNPGMAVPALYAARTAGFKVPEEVSFMTLFDVPGVQSLDPQMTTTTAGGREYAERVAARLIERIENPLLPCEQVRVDGEIVERETVTQAPSHTSSGQRIF